MSEYQDFLVDELKSKFESKIAKKQILDKVQQSINTQVQSLEIKLKSVIEATDDYIIINKNQSAQRFAGIKIADQEIIFKRQKDCIEIYRSQKNEDEDQDQELHLIDKLIPKQTSCISEFTKKVFTLNQYNAYLKSVFHNLLLD